jgi:hypothetical protein
LCRVLVLEGREFCIIINLACSFRPSSIHQHLRPPHSIVSSSSIAIKFSCRSQANYNARWSLSLARPQGGLQKFLESRNSLSLLKGSCLSSMCACVSRAVPTFFIFTAYSYTRYTEKSCFGFYTLEKSPAGGYVHIHGVFVYSGGKCATLVRWTSHAGGRFYNIPAGHCKRFQHTNFFPRTANVPCIYIVSNAYYKIYFRHILTQRIHKSNRRYCQNKRHI